MGKPIKVFRTSVAPAERVILAYAAVAGGEGFRKISFRAARVDYLFEIDKERSGIALENGVTIVARRPVNKLTAQIFGNESTDEEILDLTRATGTAAGEASPVHLSKDFNPAAKPSMQPPKDIPVAIDIIVRAGHFDRSYKRIRFYDTQIDYYEPNAQKMAKETYLKLKKGTEIGGLSSFFFIMPLQGFITALNRAKQQQQPYLDLTTATRPADTRVFDMREP